MSKQPGARTDGFNTGFVLRWCQNVLAIGAVLCLMLLVVAGVAVQFGNELLLSDLAYTAAAVGLASVLGICAAQIVFIQVARRRQAE